MQRLRRHHRIKLLGLLSFFLLFTQGCTDTRARKLTQGIRIGRTPAQGLVAIADVKFDGKDMDVLQMLVKGSSLFLTARGSAGQLGPGFSRWDIGANPELPHLTFAQADMIDSFSPMGKWVPDWYASGGLGVLGNYALTSGVAGASLINIGDTHTPLEEQRFPPLDPKSDQVPQNPDYAYRAIAVNSQIPVFYGFREQDFVATLTLQGSQLRIVNKAAYSQGGTCCVMGATTFDNVVFVAFRSSVWMFNLASNGSLQDPKIIDALNAVNITSTGQYLYVQHEPINNTNGAGRPAGIYVFNNQGDSVAHLPVSPRKFAISQDDRYLYGNLDSTAVRIYGIDWNNLGAPPE